jgi:hypothetical protein
MENLFGRPGVTNPLGPCETQCPVCTGEIESLIHPVSRKQLTKVLWDGLYGKEMDLAKDFVKCINDKRKLIYGIESIRVFKMQFLALQLIAAGLIVCVVKNRSDGTKHTLVTLGKHSSEAFQASVLDDSKWTHITTTTTTTTTTSR